MKDLPEHSFLKYDWTGRFLKFFYYELKPTIVFTIIVSVVLWVPFIYKNNLHKDIGQALIFFLYLFLFHVVLFMLITFFIGVLLTVCSYYTSWKLDRKSVGIYVIGTNLGFLLALNSTLRFTPSYKLFGQDPFITPLGFFNLLVFIAGILVIFYFLHNLLDSKPESSSRQPRIGKGFIVLGTWLILFVSTCVYNLIDEVPINMNVEKIQVSGTVPGVKHLSLGEKPNKVLLIGLDGLSWYVLDAMFKQGQLPNLGALVKNGTRASLKTFEPTVSPVVWNSIATSRTPKEHGIFGFTKFLLPGMKAFIGQGPNHNSMNWWNGINRFLSEASSQNWIKEQPLFSRQRQVPALWDIADHYGISSGVVNWFSTWPIDPLKSGSYMVSDFSGREGSKFPNDKIDAILANFNPPNRAVKSNSPLLQEPYLNAISLKFHLEANMSIELFKHFRPLLSMNYYHFVDGVHHRYWRGENRDLLYIPNEDSFHHFPPHVTDSYLLADQWVGDFISAADPGTLVLVVSDHGYCFDGYEHHNAPDGVFIAAGPGIRPNYLLQSASIYDIMPTILAVLDLPIADDVHGRVLSDMFLPNSLPAPKKVASYDWFKENEMKVDRSVDKEQEMLEYFKSLGYVN